MLKTGSGFFGLLGHQVQRHFSSTSTKLCKPLIVTEKVNEALFIAINRPDKRNCVNQETAAQLKSAFQELDDRDDIKVGVLHGIGGNFCAGYDLEELSMLGKLDKDVKGGEQSSLSMESLIKPAPMGPSHMLTNKPIIAAIDGYAVAGGLELALLCDLRVMEETAIMGVFCRRFGVPLIDGGTVRLSKIIGFGRAMDMILTGRGVDGKEALSMGLVTECVAVGTALGRANNLAERLTKFPQLCMRADRKSAYYSTYGSSSLQDALDYEFENGKEVILKEAVSGAAYFIQEGLGKHGKFNLASLEQMMSRGKNNDKKSVLLDGHNELHK